MSLGKEPEEETRKSKGVAFSLDSSQEERHQRMEQALTIPIVKYEPPVLTAVKKPGGGRLPRQPRESLSFKTDTSEPTCEYLSKNPDAIFSEKELELLIRNLYPDKTWEDDFSVFTRTVSFAKGTNEDILDVTTEVSGDLEGPQSSHFTISEKLEAHLLNAFDECIRQIILERPVHGVLFRLIRDYFIKDLAHKRNLYLSSIAFYGRVDVRLTTEIKDLEQELVDKEVMIQRLSQELQVLCSEISSIDSKFQEELNEENHEHMSELQPILNDKRRYIHKLKNMTNSEA